MIKTADVLKKVEIVIGIHSQEDNFLYEDDFFETVGAPSCLDTVLIDVEDKLTENLKRLDGDSQSIG